VRIIRHDVIGADDCKQQRRDQFPNHADSPFRADMASISAWLSIAGMGVFLRDAAS
jgi:hypothetical protein